MTWTRGLDRMGWDPRWSAAAKGYAECGRPGRVTTVDADGGCAVLAAAGPVRATLGGRLLTRMAADREEAPCVGDWVVLRQWPDGPLTVEVVLPRRNAVRGPAPGGGATPLAANVDLVAAMVSGRGPHQVESELRELLDPEEGRRLPLLLIAAEAHEQPVIGQWSGPAGADLLRWDPASGDGLDRLRERLQGSATALLFGPPRLGSRLTSLLAGARPVWSASRCTDVALLVLPAGGCLIDLSCVGTVETCDRCGGSPG